MVAVVNGYVCFTTCDAKKARQGKDPLALTGSSQDGKHKKNGLDGQPATVLGGALKNLKDAIDPGKKSDPSSPASGPPPPGGASSSSPASRVDIRA
jgi:hypothetical protein